mgnify:CR=1 FL=1
MKKQVLALALLLTLGQAAPTVAQTPKNSDPTELVDSASHDGLEAYSDTTDVADGDTTIVSQDHRLGSSSSVTLGFSDVDDFNSLFGLAGGMAGMLFVLAILLIIFVIAPIGILLVLFYFINKNRKEKMRLAQMAMQNGQPIPEQLLTEKPTSSSDAYQTGMRQLFLGVGLMIFLGYSAGRIGFGIGALVFCIGLGKVVIAKTNGNGDVER